MRSNHKSVRQSNFSLIITPKMLRTACAGLGIGLIAVIGTASADEAVRHYRIPAQSLDSGLLRLAADSGLEILFTADQMRGVTGKTLDGTMTSKQALDQLLKGSGYTYRFIDGHTVTLEKAPTQINKADPSTLKAVNVTANAIRDVKDPYNTDYVVPDATAGTKTDTPIMETPLNIQVVSKQVLKDQQVTTLAGALSNVSGVTVGSFYGAASGSPGNNPTPYQQITLRGFTSETFFRDGFRLQQGSASREMANVESVEVLKGPAAILYGMVEPGGMVNVVTKQPLATPYYAVNQQFGSYNMYRTTADATGPIAGNQNVLYRMNMSYENSGSFRDFVYNDNIFLAPTLKWIISPKTQATLEMEYQHKNYGADNGFVPLYPMTTDFSFTPITSAGRYNIPASTNYGLQSPTVQETYFGQAKWSHQFNDDWAVKHRFSANFSDNSSPFTSTPFLNYGSPDTVLRADYFNRKTTNNTYSTDLNLTGHFDTVGLKHTVLLGGDYYRLDSPSSVNSNANAFTDSFYNFAFGGLPTTSNISVQNPIQPGLNTNTSPDLFSHSWIRSDQYGFYAQDQIKLPYDFHVMGGIRYQNIQQFYSHSSISEGVYSTSGSSANALRQDAVTPRVGILWQTQDWLSLYANYSESFGANAGQVWTSATSSSAIPASSASQYEGGAKTEFFKGRLRATLAYYDLTKTNVASSDPNQTHDCGGGVGSCALAIGAIRSHGPELDIQGEILPGWKAIANWANIDIRVVQTNNTNTTADGLSVGDRYFGVPRNTARFFTTYDFQNESLKGLKVGGGTTIRDSQLAVNTPTIGPPASVTDVNIAGYATVDLLAAYTVKMGKSKITAQLNVNNLLDKQYYTGASFGMANSMYATFGQPRSFMGSIGIQY